MSSKMKSPLALSAALAGGLVLTGSAFAMQPLSTGYMVSASAVAEGRAAPSTRPTKRKRPPARRPRPKASAAWRRWTADKDGKISKAEFAAAHDNDDSKFAAHDTNSDGFISAEEMKAHMGGSGGAGKMMEEGKCGEGKCGAQRVIA